MTNENTSPTITITYIEGSLHRAEKITGKAIPMSLARFVFAGIGADVAHAGYDKADVQIDSDSGSWTLRVDFSADPQSYNLPAQAAYMLSKSVERHGAAAPETMDMVQLINAIASF